MIQGVHTKYFTHFIFNITNYHLSLEGVCRSYRAQTDIAFLEFYLHYSHVVFVSHNSSTCTQALFKLLEFQHGEEREHHLKEGLCLYCGEKGHIAHNCPKSKAAKACAATMTAESKSDSADSKK